MGILWGINVYWGITGQHWNILDECDHYATHYKVNNITTFHSTLVLLLDTGHVKHEVFTDSYRRSVFM